MDAGGLGLEIIMNWDFEVRLRRPSTGSSLSIIMTLCVLPESAVEPHTEATQLTATNYKGWILEYVKGPVYSEDPHL